MPTYQHEAKRLLYRQEAKTCRGRGDRIEARAKYPEGERARPHAELTSSGPHKHHNATVLEGPARHPRLSASKPIQHGTQQPAIGT